MRTMLAMTASLALACGSGASITLHSEDTLALVAVRDGDGAWRPIAPAGGTYSFTVATDRYAVLYVCEAPDLSSSVHLVLAARTELGDLAVSCFFAPSEGTPVTVSGTLAGLDAATTGRIDIAGRTASSDAAGAWTLQVPYGTYDVIARRMTTAPLWDRIARADAAPIAEGATFDFDFTTQGAAPDAHVVAFQGSSAGETTSALVVFFDAGGSPFAAPYPDGHFLTVPQSLLRPADRHAVTAGSNVSGVSFRNVTRFSAAGADFTADFPPLPADPAIGAGESSPYLRPSAGLATTGDPDVYELIYTQRPPGSSRVWDVRATRGWIAAAQATSFTLPDVSMVQGFSASWALSAGELQWQQFQWWNGDGLPAIFDEHPTADELEGRETRSTQRLGTTTL